jgi:BlaI family penicillinase repressor
MKTLWKTGALSAREIHERLAGRTGWAYSTTRTTVERMVAKRLLTKRSFHGLNVYAPAISRPQGIARLVREFAEQVLDLPSPPVAALFAESDALTPAEIAELRTLLGSTRKAKRRRA